MRQRLCCCCCCCCESRENAYPQDRQENVDAEVAATPALEEDTKRGKEDGEDDLADVAVEFVSVGVCGAERRERLT